MGRAFQNRITIWPVLLFWGITIWLGVNIPTIVWAETPGPQENMTVKLEDGTVIELSDTAIRRIATPANAASAADQTALWSISANKPQLPLLFTNNAGVPLLFYFIAINEHYGEYHALRVEDGQEQWMQPVWSHNGEEPISLVFLSPWIYFGHGMWLEQMNPDDGRIVSRYPARMAIKLLRAMSDGKLEVQVKDNDFVGKVTLTFQDGCFHPYIAASGSGGNLLLSLGLWKRARWVMEEFDFGEYLDLYRLRRKSDPPPSPQTVFKTRDFNLRKAEEAYRRAYQADPANPAFALYLALTLYYQQRYAEAETYTQAALKQSAPFWEESLRLGGFVCEALQLTQWADAFYAQGMARYIQDIPAPPEFVSLIEMLIHFGGTRAATAGPFDRAWRVLQLRRQIMPYTEGDAHFSRRYIRALRHIGQQAQADAEAQRITQFRFWNDVHEPTPFSFAGFLIATVCMGGLLILYNASRHRFEWPLVLIAIGAVGLRIGYGPLNRWKILILAALILGYIGAIAFVRRRREQPGFSLWRMMFNMAVSSYIVLLAGVHLAYLGGQFLSRSPLGGKTAELAFIGAWLGGYLLNRSKGSRTMTVRYLKLFCLLWALVWGQLAWLHHYFGFGVGATDWNVLFPSIDLGHPQHRVYIDRQVRSAVFRTRDLLFTQAVFHQLGEDRDIAEQAYQQMPDDARAVNNLGVLSLGQDALQARKYFERALALHPGFAPALYNLGVLNGDVNLLEQAQAGEPWRVKAYRTYAPGKPWIAIPTWNEWNQAVYWSQGGFPVRGFTEIAVAVRDFLSAFLSGL